jgi:hypothetical protein
MFHRVVLPLALLGVLSCVDGDPAPPRSDEDTSDDACDEVVAAKRIVRLTFNQQANAISQLFGATVAENVRRTFDIKAGQHTFPPLANAREGSVVTDGHFLTDDNIAQYVSKHVSDTFAETTGCSADGDACARDYLLTTAERAFRRPLEAADRDALLGVYSSVVSDDGSVAEGVQYGIYAVLISPHYLYRTEFGDDSAKPGALSDTEFASALSFFVLDAPPDAALLEAAANGKLQTADGINEEVYRLLRTPAVQRNMEAAILAYFQLGALDSVVIDPARAPEFDLGMRNSMLRESELFLRNTLWPGKLTELLTARTSYVNDRLASLYGISFPPTGATLDANGFAKVELPETRSGLLTLPGFLTARSRPDQPSVVGRGLAVNSAFLCVQNPPFPSNLADTIANIGKSQENLTEREKSEYRQSTPPCQGCHPGFDPYGIALGNFGIIGQYLEKDERGRPIDPSVKLPSQAGGVEVANARAMAEALAQSDAFEQCMAKNMLAYALAEGGVALDSCAAKSLVKRFRQTDGSFAALVSEIVKADSFRVRATGVQNP